jgi:predicted signal transduction protein with EAL and GGDEF domain
VTALVFALDPAQVKPGWLGLGVTLVMAVVLVLLMVNFTRRLKRIDVDREQGPDPDRVADEPRRPL